MYCVRASAVLGCLESEVLSLTAHTYTHTCTHTHTHTCTHTCTRTCTHACTHARMHACTHTHAAYIQYAYTHCIHTVHPKITHYIPTKDTPRATKETHRAISGIDSDNWTCPYACVRACVHMGGWVGGCGCWGWGRGEFFFFLT